MGHEEQPLHGSRQTRRAASVAGLASITTTSSAQGAALARKLEAIKAFLAASPDPNAARLLDFAREVERDVRGKKYGLVFEEHKERVDVVLEESLPVLTEDRTRFVDRGGALNFLVEGDNLAALKLLEKTHRGRIDVIYIDPPYNTGSRDFMYNDRYVDGNDLFRHSKWLSFMEKRLRLARSIMSSRGVIFISIDDNEHAELKVLCDEIFGPSNFITSFPWQSRQSNQRGSSSTCWNGPRALLVYEGGYSEDVSDAGWRAIGDVVG